MVLLYLFLGLVIGIPVSTCLTWGALTAAVGIYALLERDRQGEEACRPGVKPRTHAFSFLRSRGYDITELPVMVTDAPPGSWWVSEPGEEDYAHKAYDWMRERDLLELAEALEFSRMCAFCGLPAESTCPDCGAWCCYEDRRDFSPDFDDHLCVPCLNKRNMAMVQTWREMAARGEVLNEKQQYWVDR